MADAPKFIGRYQVLESIGGGRLGNLYLVRDTALERHLALRLVPRLPANRRERLERTLGSIAQVPHPGLAVVFDSGDHEGRLFFARQYIEGQTLARLVAQKASIPPTDRLQLMVTVCEVLACAHRCGLAGLAVEPGDVIIGPEGEPHIVDLGLAPLVEGVDADGDPSYLAPETIAGRPVDSRSDVFAAGVLLYELFTSERPFGRGSAEEIRKRIVDGARWIRHDDLDPALARIIARALQFEAAARYQSIEHFLDDLRDVRDRSGETPSVTEPSDDNVRFTVFRPPAMAPQRWYPLLIFAHLGERRPDAPADEPDPVAQVEAAARAVLGAAAAKFPRIVQDAGAAIPHQAMLRIVPSVGGLTFNPPELSFLWTESVHKADFRVQAGASLQGRTARGSIDVRMGAISVALITIAIPIDAGVVDEKPPVYDVFQPYRRIFASYSHKDTAIVRQFENYARAIGDSYMRDVVDLRAGDIWSDRLLHMIDAADVFQLFWSNNSLESSLVRREWEHALTVNKANFVRPLYWESPLPERDGLPPPALKARHFASVAVADVPVAALVVRLPGGNVVRFRTAFYIGRDPACEVCVPDARASRRHAHVSCARGRWSIHELGSGTGLFVDGERVETAPIRGGISVRLGEDGPLLEIAPAVGSAPAPADPDEEPGEGTIIDGVAERYFGSEGDEEVGGRTVMIRRAFKLGQATQRRRYLWMVAAVALLGLGAAGYAVYAGWNLRQREEMARGVFYQMKAQDVIIARIQQDLVRAGSLVDPDNLSALQDRRRHLEEQYEEIAPPASRRLSERDRLILRVTRLFGECEVAVPSEYLREVNRYIEIWRSTRRFEEGVTRAQENGYTRTIAAAFRDRQLPPQYFYLALVESGFIPSHVGPPTRFGFAKGMWQFVPETGQRYGLRSGPYYQDARVDLQDERFDWQKATHAAASYIKDLYATDAQASGLLVMASYRRGEGRVVDRLRKMPLDPRGRNWWTLLAQYREDLLGETYDYVFSIVSAAVIGENPRLFGFRFDNPLASRQVHADLSASDTVADARPYCGATAYGSARSGADLIAPGPH